MSAKSERAALTQARRFEAEALTKATGTNAEAFGEQLDAWWRDRKSRLAPGTVTSYSNSMKHLDPLRPVPLGKLATGDLDRLYVKLSNAGLSASSVRKVHYIAAGVLRTAKRHKLVSENVAADAEPPKMVRPETRPPTVSELTKILAAASDDDFRDFLVVACTTGARRGEVCALTLRDVDLDSATITIRHNLAEDTDGVYLKDTKNHRARTVRLDDATVAVLRAHLERARIAAEAVESPLTDSRYVFSPRPGNDTPYTPKVMTRRTSRLLDRLGLSDLRLHDLRHFVGSQLVAAGVDVETVRARLGHSRASTTLAIYTHAVAGTQDQEAADVIGRVVTQARRTGSAPTPDEE